jgi:hypothetical protein
MSIRGSAVVAAAVVVVFVVSCIIMFALLENKRSS